MKANRFAQLKQILSEKSEGRDVRLIVQIYLIPVLKISNQVL